MEAQSLTVPLCIHSAKIDLVEETEGQMRPYRESRVPPSEEIIDKPSGYAAMSFMVILAQLRRKSSGSYVDCPVGIRPSS